MQGISGLVGSQGYFRDIGIMEKKMETIIMGLDKVLGLGLRVLDPKP